MLNCFRSKIKDSKNSSDVKPADLGGRSFLAGRGQPDITSFREDVLTAHNQKRKLHGSQPLKLSNELNAYAQNWAEQLAKTGTLKHSVCQMGFTRIGENIAYKWSSEGADYRGDEVTEAWYCEIKKHNFEAGRTAGTGHFTQVVWKATTELGVGKAKDGSGKVFVVGSYKPGGNMLGKFKENVLPLQ